VTERTTGGPAFPWCGDLNDCPTINLGMTLRDYFAAAALQGLCAGFSTTDKNWPRDDEPEGYDVAAEHSYQMADAMLKKRDK
jgi:hypothetical protein